MLKTIWFLQKDHMSQLEQSKNCVCKALQQIYVKKKETFACNSDIQKIVDYYSEKPTDFEGLCSELFESFFE